MFALEAVVARHLAAGRQRAALLGDALDVPAQLDFLGEQGLARAAVGVAFVGETQGVAPGQLGGGNEDRGTSVDVGHGGLR
ncbi:MULTISPECIES: hypothetical protein [unclassified Rhodanobacter]|uniref:hypothetical protein n=1 Tax=unclassified Rhodanobacter TaxID=2621553 RepID=UPI000B00D9D4|nr:MULTISPECIES: hypothetical protein [unclassified Rhodanobacter]